MSVDRWLSRRYKINEYTCSDFTREVWLHLTGVDIAPALHGLLQVHDGRGLRREHVKQFRALPAPVDPCLVVMQRPGHPTHIAVYLRGKILQITERGVTFLEPRAATAFHKHHRYIQCIL